MKGIPGVPNPNIGLLLLPFVFLLLPIRSSASASSGFPPVQKLPMVTDLPDPFKMLDGTPVTTKEQWFEKRRPELKALFQHYIYGYMPPAPGITSKVTKTNRNVYGGKATLKEIEIGFSGLPEDAPKIHLALFTPNQVKGRAPVFLMLNRCGNHTVADCPSITIDESMWVPSNCSSGEDGRGTQADFHCVEYLIDRGYALATFNPGTFAPDDKTFTGGIYDCYPDLDPRTRWGAISAWAWGLHRAVDYLVHDVRLDRKRICVTGHSRRGKTALLAAALDERIALVVPHQSGTCGSALGRDNEQETIARIGQAFPHWFNKVFPQFADREELLPVDQHLLMALVAPRPLLDTSGKKDLWANPDNALKALHAADEVYKFLGAEGTKGSGMLQEKDGIRSDNAGNLLQHRLDTVHTMNRDYWGVILDFADLNLGAPTR